MYTKKRNLKNLLNHTALYKSEIKIITNRIQDKLDSFTLAQRTSWLSVKVVNYGSWLG